MSGRADAQAGEMPSCARPVGYVPRQTHECDAAVLVRQHLAEFFERCEERAGPLLAFVKGELEGFAGCGNMARLRVVGTPRMSSFRPCRSITTDLSEGSPGLGS